MSQVLDQGYLIDRDVAMWEGIYIGSDRINVVVRWGLGAPEGLEGTIAAEAYFTFTDGNREVLVTVEDNCLVDDDLVRALCEVYGVRGVVDVRVVRRRDIKDLGAVRVK